MCPDGFKVAFTIDCMTTESLRTGGGPMTSGQFAARYPGLIQMAFYTGYKKIHVLKINQLGLLMVSLMALV